MVNYLIRLKIKFKQQQRNFLVWISLLISLSDTGVQEPILGAARNKWKEDCLKLRYYVHDFKKINLIPVKDPTVYFRLDVTL